MRKFCFPSFCSPSCWCRRCRRCNPASRAARARPFYDLYAQTYLGGGNTTTSVSASFSDAVGAPDRRNVVLYRYDASAGALSANDTGLVFASVYYEAEGSANALNTLVGRWW